MRSTSGIHHVTAITSHARATVQFYGEALGLRLVKRTVNFDDPGTWHLYFGDETGAPGTLLTFFPYEGAPAGRTGAGMAAVTALAVPAGSIGWWLERLASLGIAHEAPVRRFGESVIALKDPDGMHLELVGVPAAAALPAWGGGTVPAAHAIRGVRGVTLWHDGDVGADALLTGVLGFPEAGREEGVRRFQAGDPLGSTVDLRDVGGFWRGRGGAGTVHHVAFRAGDREAQQAVRTQLAEAGLAPTPVVDRQYFESVYFRAPGGVLFEVATDAPGFLVDEPVGTLGSTLQLPSQYERLRERISGALPALERGAEVTA